MGLVGLLCAQLGAASVLLTDYEPAVLAHLGQNAALNGLQQRCASQQLDWRRPHDSLRPEQLGGWRLVLAADVLYASVVVQPFIDTLAMLLHAEGERALGFGSEVLICRCHPLYTSFTHFPSSPPHTHTAGVALIGHQVRRAVVLDRATRLPRLEDADEPLEAFKASCGAAGLEVRVLSSRETCSNVDSDPMVLLAVGQDAERLNDLPIPLPGGD